MIYTCVYARFRAQRQIADHERTGFMNLIIIKSRAHYITRITKLHGITGRSDVKYDIRRYNRTCRNIEARANARKTATIRAECARDEQKYHVKQQNLSSCTRTESHVFRRSTFCSRIILGNLTNVSSDERDEKEGQYSLLAANFIAVDGRSDVFDGRANRNRTIGRSSVNRRWM